MRAILPTSAPASRPADCNTMALLAGVVLCLVFAGVM